MVKAERLLIRAIAVTGIIALGMCVINVYVTGSLVYLGFANFIFIAFKHYGITKAIN